MRKPTTHWVDGIWRWRVGKEFSRAPFWGIFSTASGLFLSFLFAFIVHQDAKEFDQTRFQLESLRAWEALESKIEHHESALRLVHSFVENNIDLQPQEFETKWHHMVDRLSAPLNFPGWAQLGYATALGEQHSRSKRETGELHDHTFLGPNKVRIPVQLITNVFRMPSLLGVDLNNLAGTNFGFPVIKEMFVSGRWRTDSIAARVVNQRSHRQTLLASHHQERPRITAPFTLMEGGADPGVIAFRMFIPVYRISDRNLKSAAPVRVSGFVFGTLILDRLISSHSVAGQSGIGMTIEADMVEPTDPAFGPSQWNRLTGGSYWNREGKLVRQVTDSPHSRGLRTTLLRNQYRRPWRLQIFATTRFLSRLDQGNWRMLLVSGACLSGLLGLSVWMLIRRYEESTALLSKLARSDLEIRSLASQKERIGRDLHDRTLQSLFTAELSLSAAKASPEGSNKDAGVQSAQDRFSNVLDLIQEISRDLRQFILFMEAPKSGSMDFIHSVKAWMDRVGRATGCEIRVHVEPTFSNTLTSSLVPEFTSVLSECTSNAIRHGKAGRIDLTFGITPGWLVVRVEDDGSGFEPETATVAGNGLRNLSSRARNLGGRFEITSNPGGPTIAAFWVPLPKPINP